MSKNIMRFILCLAILKLDMNLYSSLGDKSGASRELVSVLSRDIVRGEAILVVAESSPQGEHSIEAERVGIQKVDDTQTGSKGSKVESRKGRRIVKEIDEAKPTKRKRAVKEVDEEKPTKRKCAVKEVDEENPTKRKRAVKEVDEEKPTKRKCAVTNKGKADTSIQKNESHGIKVKCNYRAVFKPFADEFDDALGYLEHHDFLTGLMGERYSLKPITNMNNAIISNAQVIVPLGFLANPDTKRPLLTFLEMVISLCHDDDSSSDKASGRSSKKVSGRSSKKVSGRPSKKASGGSSKKASGRSSKKASDSGSKAEPGSESKKAPVYTLYSVLSNREKKGMTHDDSEGDKELQSLLSSYGYSNPNMPLGDVKLVVCRVLHETDGCYHGLVQKPFEFDICEIATEDYNALSAIRQRELAAMPRDEGSVDILLGEKETYTKTVDRDKINLNPAPVVLLGQDGKYKKIVDESELRRIVPDAEWYALPSDFG